MTQTQRVTPTPGPRRNTRGGEYQRSQTLEPEMRGVDADDELEQDDIDSGLDAGRTNTPLR